MKTQTRILGSWIGAQCTYGMPRVSWLEIQSKGVLLTRESLPSNDNILSASLRDIKLSLKRVSALLGLEW